MIFGRKPRAIPVPTPDLQTRPEAPPAGRKVPPHDYAAEAATLVHYFDFTSDDIASSIAACRAAENTPPVGRVAWFIPYGEGASVGDVALAFHVAEHLRARGIAPVVVVIGAPDEAAARAMVARTTPTLAGACEIVVLDRIDEVPELGPLDAAVATSWMTSLPVLFLRDVRKKLFLIQDWEPAFYPAGATSELVRASYRFGFTGLCRGPALAQAYRALGGAAEAFEPAIDRRLWHADRPAAPPGTPLRVFCASRPDRLRDGYALAAAALRDVKAQLFERVDIVFAGADWDPAAHGLRGCARNLGALSPSDMAALFRTVDVGLCLTAGHPPAESMLELMASGAAVVTTRDADWLFGASEPLAFTCEASRSELADTLLAALQDDSRRAERAARAARAVAERFGDVDALLARLARTIAGEGTTPSPTTISL